MRSEARAALLDMLAAAQGANLTMVVSSSYRSYDDQVATFNQNVASGGRDYAERTSAHAGHSEHQLGTTADMTSKSAGYQLEAFEGTAEAKWLAENSWKFGFIISYPAGTEAITGYAYEPWHIRYLGKDVAQQVKSSGLTLHQFLLK
jgi:D-alanyl-D-alanine carboxypeptidase